MGDGKRVYEVGFLGKVVDDEMDLGKTIQSIVFLARLAETTHEVWGPRLIVVPNGMVLDWEMELK